MNSLSPRPMRLLIVEFPELYARHLCRHSQFGINVAHLAALFGIWYAIYGLLYWLAGLVDIERVVFIPAGIYLAALVPNVPLRVFLASALFMGLMLAAVYWLPAPWWLNLLLIPTFYKLQSWSHKIYTAATDMTEFNRKYSKGSVLFVVLLIYEVPIVLNYLLFEGNSSRLSAESSESAAAGRQEPLRV